MTANPVETIALHPCFKGKRDYVHGTDMYEAITSFVRTRLTAPIARLQLAIHRFYGHEPDLVWCGAAAAPQRPVEAVVDFSVVSDGKPHFGWLTDTRRPVSCRAPYDEDRMEAYCRFEEDSISIEADSGFLPIEVTVSLTKQLHIRRLPAPAGRWIFTKLDLRRLLETSDAAALTILLKENLYHRLTKSEILSRGESLGFIYFSLVRS